MSKTKLLRRRLPLMGAGMMFLGCIGCNLLIALDYVGDRDFDRLPWLVVYVLGLVGVLLIIVGRWLPKRKGN